MTAEPDPGTSLERRGESLPDVSVPHRAGAIVSEFVASIVQETQARAAEIIEAAEQEALARRQAALDDAGRAREQMVFLASELPELLDELRHAADRLSGGEGVVSPFQGPVRPVLEHGAGAVAAGSAPPSRERAELEPHEPQYAQADETAAQADETAAQADETEGVTIVDAEIAADDLEAEAAEAQQGRLARMTDEELARAYGNAARAAARERHEARAESLRRLAQGAVEEALRRPTFTKEEPPEPARRRRPLLRRRRRRVEVSFAELRDACRTARQERPALEQSAG